MHYLVYLSSAKHAFSKSDLVALLNKARTNNESRGISGILLYKDGNFIQILEGAREVIEARFEVIRRDPRHTDVTILDQGDVDDRMFSTWSMAFRDLDDPELARLPGFSHFLNKSITIEDFRADPRGLRQLLELFRDPR